MRFSFATVSAVVLAAVSLVAGDTQCSTSNLNRCITATKNKYGGNRLADCQGRVVDDHTVFNPRDHATLLCLGELISIYSSPDLVIPPECNACLCGTNAPLVSVNC